MKISTLPLLSMTALLAISTTLRAGTEETPAKQVILTQPEETTVPLNIINTTVNQTFQSNFERHHGRDPKANTVRELRSNNNTNTWSYEVELARRVPLTKNNDWFLRLGVDVNRYDFGDNRSLAPNTLQSYAAEIGLEYFRKGQLGFFILSKPGLYFSHNINTGGFDFPTTIALAYPVVDGKFYIIGGVYTSMLTEYPVLPVGGVLWHINDQWDLQAYLPRPRIVYKASKKLDLFAGGEVVGGAFVMDSNNSQPKISRTTVEYYELRVGAGFAYHPSKAVTIDLSGGYALERKWDFTRVNEYAATRPAPYTTLRVNFEF